MTVQLVVLIAVLAVFSDSFYLFYAASIVLSVAAVIWILNDSSNPAYKIAWIILILIFPIFGGIFYLVFGKTRLNRGLRRRMQESVASVELPADVGKENLEKLASLDPDAATQARYLSANAASPLWTGSPTTYLPTGESAFARIVEELKRAERFIYLEFFIIGEGRMWRTILDILVEKAKAGLDVRVMYDDFGCMSRLPPRYDKRLETMGIRCAVFNPLRPILSSNHNHRDHRKILVIDGRVGFTGGLNLADEYINEFERFGRWKDNAIMVEGRAVSSMTLMFLRLWKHARGDKTDQMPAGLLPSALSPAGPEDGFVQPYGDSPLDEEPVGENVYLNLIGKAKRYLYITTPYLVIDNEMLGALVLAAKSGLDVRIITPHIPDKWYVHAVTRANYRPLIDGGVRIFEYTPGFIHSKTFVADDRYGVVGTVNLDFRSFFLHFECGVCLYGCGSVAALRDDFLSTLEQCQEVTAAELDSVRLWRKAQGWMLRVFSPLL